LIAGRHHRPRQPGRKSDLLRRPGIGEGTVHG
jgi:hypothetical protein